MFEKPLSEPTDACVENVVVFISDSLRYDHIPPSFQQMGVLGKAIAPSTYTASSVPSMFSGLYPAEHSVWDFNSVLNNLSIFRKIDNSGYKTDHMFNWPIEAVEADGPIEISDLDQSDPFLFVWHHLGAHIPYGETIPSEWDSMEEYYKTYQPEEHRTLYADSVSQSVDQFKNLVETLEKDGILHKTLVIFVSDHGDLLGERGGIWGHGSVITPELVEVPMLFTGAGLPKNESYGRVLSGTDIAPTILSIFNEQIPGHMDGMDVWDSVPSDNRKVRSDLWNRTIRNHINYGATSMWDDDGGYVSRIEPWSQHTLFTLVNHLFRYNQASMTRSLSPKKLYELYLIMSSETVQYGSPSFSFEDARNDLPTSFDAEAEPVCVADTDRLRQLGYLQ